MTDLDDIFKKTAEQIKNPINTDDLEYLLAINGLDVPLKPIAISRRMKALGFTNRIKMYKGVRARYWVNNLMTDSAVAHKIKFIRFLTDFLADKTEINAKELNLIVRENHFNASLLNKHFYEGEGIERKWNGWLLIRRDGEKIYKKLDIPAQE
jgi:hypothetical protein